MTTNDDHASEVGPLGRGHEPAKDPMKGLRGVQAGTLVLEAITFYLSLTVILRVDGGEHWTPFNWGYITVLATLMLLAAFLQRVPKIQVVIIVLQVAAVAGGILVHASLFFPAAIFAAVWWYIFHLRSRLIARMERGLLTTQHS